jgi:succinyl-diaminopimelate desuccinylase
MMEKIIKEVFNNRNEIIKNSIELINIPSLTGDLDANVKCLNYLASIAGREGIKYSFSKTKNCLVLEIGKGKETIGVLTHVDVVGIGDRDKWKTPPFEGKFDGQYIIGRGAMDDKVPTAIIFNILRTLNRNTLEYKRRLQLIIGTSEEGEWSDMESFRNEFDIPDFSFTPDGAFPIHNIEKGYADVEISFPLEANFTGGTILEVTCGDSSNTIPSMGTFVYKNHAQNKTSVIVSHGSSTHSSLPENGENALTKLAWMIINLGLQHPRFNVFLNFITSMHEDYYGRFLGFDNTETTFNGEYIGKTAANPTVLKYSKGQLILNINIRHKYGVTSDIINHLFHQLSERFDFSYHIIGYQEPLYVSRANPHFEIMNRAYETVTNQKGGFTLARGTSYAKALPNSVCWGPVFPEEEDSCHRENEKISLKSTIQCAEIYSRFLIEASTTSV